MDGVLEAELFIVATGVIGDSGLDWGTIPVEGVTGTVVEAIGGTMDDLGAGLETTGSLFTAEGVEVVAGGLSMMCKGTSDATDGFSAGTLDGLGSMTLLVEGVTGTVVEAIGGAMGDLGAGLETTGSLFTAEGVEVVAGGLSMMCKGTSDANDGF